MEISDHLLRGSMVRTDLISGKDSGEFRLGLPDTIIIHYTAGPSADSAVRSFKDTSRKASAHLVVDFDGTVIQVIPFNRVAWHAGVSAWKSRQSLNQFSIGIEIVNAGNLTRTERGFTSWFGRTYPESEVVQLVHPQKTSPEFWHRFTEPQIVVVFEICRLLKASYHISEILGHYDISPGRKIDPGPAFPMQRLRDSVLNDPNDPSEASRIGIVAASSLNIRSGPSVDNSTVSEPLPRGTKVKILEYSGDWAKVECNVTGWVAKRFIEKA